MYRHAGQFDAVVSAAGSARFGALAELSDEDYLFSLRNKLMGQVNLVRIGQRHISDNGSFTLTSGVLAREPMPGSSAISMVNAGLEGFVRAAQLELPRGIRINVVSPVWVLETLRALGRDPATGMPAERVARAYVASVTGTIGREVAKALQADHEVVTASRSGGALRVDLAEPDSLEAMFRQAGKFDAVVSAAGAARFGPWQS